MSGEIFQPMESLEDTDVAKRNPLLCYLCNEQYDDPCILSCFHSFCMRCLRGRAADSQMLCPLCGATTHLKEGNSLPPPDPLLKFMVESSLDEKASCANCDKAIFDGEPTGRGQYHQYVSNALDKEYEAVIDGMAIRRAPEKFCVLFSTLNDRISGKVSVDCVTTGTEPLLSLEEEKLLVDHIDLMANFGYGYSRAEVTAIATDLAIHLGKRSKDDPPLSMQWFYDFVERWPDLQVKKPRSLELQRAKATSKETITHYLDDLGSILKKYRLEDSPQRIYNVDEKGLVENHVPPSIVSSQQVPTAVVAPRSSTTTVIGCGNASGNAINPFFVFKGQRMREELL